MKKGRLILLIAFLLGLFPTMFFIRKFIFNPISDSPSDWETFAVYFSGTTGTLFSIFAGWLLFKTLEVQNKQNTETIFFNYLDTFSKEKKEVSQILFGLEEKMEKTIHRNEKVERGTEN